jgi:hypothetical protein
MSALVAATMAPIEIVAIHFEANVGIRIGLERTSPRRHHGRSSPADRTVGVGRQLPLQTLKLRRLISRGTVFGAVVRASWANKYTAPKVLGGRRSRDRGGNEKQRDECWHIDPGRHDLISCLGAKETVVGRISILVAEAYGSAIRPAQGRSLRGN